MRDYIALAIPFFFLMIGIELLWGRTRNRQLYRLNDAITDLSCGIASQVTTLLYGALQFAIYAALYERFRLLTLPSWLAWTAAFLGVDFVNAPYPASALGA